MGQPTSHQRSINNNNFGNHTVISQGDIHYHLTHGSLSSEADRKTHVIPYPRNEDVIQRQDLVKRLNLLLPREPKFHSAALWGLGGSGKTQIALDYAYRRCEDEKCSVFWVHADSKATFIHDYKTIASKLGIDQTAAADGNALLRSVRNGIEACLSWVLILDNADNLELFGVGLSADEASNNLYEYIPNGPTGVVLWTSRDAHIAGTLVGAQRGIEVTSMESGEALKLLQVTRDQKESIEEPEDVETLLRELEWFPLAISQAGAYMKGMQITASKYLILLRESKRRWDILKVTEFDRHRRPEMPNSVLDTWTVSMERIQSENIMAYQVLHIIAYLDNQNLPRELLIKISQCSNEDTTRQLEEMEVLSAIRRLQEFSFLKMRHIEDGDPSYEMHKLVQEAARYRTTMRSLQGASEQGTLMQAEASDEVYYIGIALQALSELFPASEPESWGRCERYLAHAIGMSVWAKISKREADTSELLSKASGYLYDRGRWREKAFVDQRALELRRQVLGERHPYTLDSIASLAAAYHYQGQHEKAKDCYKEAIELRRQTLGEKHPDTLRATSLLGNVYQSHGQYREAEALYKKTLPLQREVLGEKHLHTLQSLASISGVYHYQGRYAEAKPIKIKTLALQREVLGEKHPLTLWNIGSLAATCQGLGQYEEAKDLYQQTLDLRRETLGENHPDTLRSITQLGAIYQDLGKYKLAEDLAREALELELKMLGETHPYTLQSKHNLAVALRSRGHWKDALALMQERVLGEWESSSGGLEAIRQLLGIMKERVIFQPDSSHAVIYPRLAELSDGTILATSAYSGDHPPHFPIFASENGGATWEWRSNLTDQVNGLGFGSQPALAELTFDLGRFKAGTVLASGNSAGANGTNIDLYASFNKGKTWEFISNVARGSAPSTQNGNPCIWEPFILPFNNTVGVFYSDQRDPLHGQKLAHQESTDLEHWGDVINDVAYPLYTDRPGMTVIDYIPPLKKWIFVHEFPGGDSWSGAGYPVYYRLSDSPFDFRYAYGYPIVVNGVQPSSSPYVVWTPEGGINGTIIVSDADHQSVFTNRANGQPDQWEEHNTPQPKAYSRALHIFKKYPNHLMILGAGNYQGVDPPGTNRPLYASVVDVTSVLKSRPGDGDA
ncbi:hypothetical protein TGAM01_v205790 [Trichoderma gamsii]|uniref:ORC1/DEAH AAA+ ATPase domain-containing protein n=1 Tax=Trichoderma gamsii TaxID=398673 RepID=A0A2P4ZMI4_9HYPO|nr:hypothetical protein TGAM01_v205790 [Trichoderma gamsii]PON25496.1 hypothetical protein TGAM01_v205790 [Trichoderma gamsii]